MHFFKQNHLNKARKFAQKDAVTIIQRNNDRSSKGISNTIKMTTFATALGFTVHGDVSADCV